MAKHMRNSAIKACDSERDPSKSAYETVGALIFAVFPRLSNSFKIDSSFWRVQNNLLSSQWELPDIPPKLRQISSPLATQQIVLDPPNSGLRGYSILIELLNLGKTAEFYASYLSSRQSINRKFSKSYHPQIDAKLIGRYLRNRSGYASVDAYLFEKLDPLCNNETREGYRLQSKYGKKLVWRISNEDGSIKVEANSLPVDVHTALQTMQNSHHLTDGDYNFRYNDSKYRWICKQDWNFETSVSLSKDWHGASKILLVFHGLDTATCIYIDEALALETDNMFQRYTLDVMPFLRHQHQTEFHLRITFKNMVKYSQEQHDAYPYEVPDDFTPASNGEKYRNYVRKEQCSFSWDWGPCFLPCGIYKDIELVYVDAIFIHDTTVEVLKQDNEWLVRCKLWYTSHKSESVTFGLSCNDAVSINRQNIVASEGTVQLSLLIHASTVKLWWPNGHGEQPLYDLYIQAVSSTGAKLQVVSKKIGFRTLELVQDLDENRDGSSFYFVVNGRPIFSKGANFIPVDPFESRVTRPDLRTLILNAVDANMNMLRVWGGGVYQQDAFYELCDEFGILVWQEFMFACAMYPVNEKFLDSVRQEVRHQVCRLMHHTCVCLWSGNNENEEALVTAWYEPVKQNPYVFTIDYHRLYHETIMPEVLELDKSRIFISSSPFNGTICLQPFTERFKVQNPRAYGDTHYYNYKDDGTDVSKYPVCRFASEYGFQGMPSFKSLQRHSCQEDWHPLSQFLVQRNHHRYGQEEILLQISYLFHLPGLPNSVDVTCSKEQFETFCRVSQLTQALCIKAQTEHYRRLVGTNKYCMGALYWQFNDVWCAPTWSSLEHGDYTWKLLHNWAKDIFVPVLVSMYEDRQEAQLCVVACNDTAAEVDAHVVIEAWNYLESRLVSRQTSVPAKIVACSALQVFKISTTDLTGGAIKDGIVIVVSLVSLGKVLSENFLYLGKIGGVTSKPKIHFKPLAKCLDEALQSVTQNFELSSDVVVPFVTLETREYPGRFHPNGFTLIPGRPVKVSFRFYSDPINNGYLLENMNSEYLWMRTDCVSLWDHCNSV